MELSTAATFDNAISSLLSGEIRAGSNGLEAFTDEDIRKLSDLLRRSGRETWSSIPRIYATLRMIDQLQMIDAFVNQKITDKSFLFEHKTLPKEFNDPSARSAFLHAQVYVLSKGFDLVKPNGRHRHFAETSQVPLQTVAELGKGAFGHVDMVISTLSNEQYARKRILRGRTSLKDRRVLEDLESELQILKKLSHRHIVSLIGSYTDPKYVGIIMLPVADCDLGTFLESTTMDTKERSLLRTFFGCLTNATEYLQTHKIRHRDIKPQNVLVKAHQIFVTDFGASYDWSGRNDSITIGPTSKTPRYCAPEVAESGAKGSAAEIFSLGCVFLEMWTILCDRKLSELAAYMATNGTCMSAYHANITAVFMWCDMLASGHGFDALKPATWIKSMLQIAPQQRWTVHMLSECIGEVDLDPEVSVSFIGSCCREDHEIAESVHASTFHPSELLYQSRPLGGSRKEFAPPMHPVETILEVPNPQTPSYRDTLPDKVINWSRTARQPPPLPPRAQPIMIDRDRETTSHNVRAEIVKPSQGSIHDTEEPMSSESNESICMRHHDHRAPESSGTRDTGPRLNDTHVERRVHDGAEIKAEQNFCFGHGDNRRRNTSVHGDNLVNRSGTPSIRQSSMESVKRSHRSSASNSVHPKQGYPPRDRRSMRERLHRMVLPLDVPRSNKALVGLKETHTQFIDRLSKIEPLHGTSWATTTFMNTRAFKVKGELRSLLCDLVDALDNLGVAYIATGAGLECSYPTDGLWEIFNYTSMHHQRARVLKRWRSAFSGHRSSSKIRNAWYEHKLVFDITLAKRTEKMDNKFVLLFKTVSGGPSGNHLLHLLPSIFNRHGVGEDFLPSFVKTIKLELERQIC